MADGIIASPNQFWRWITLVAFHMGLIHLILVLAAQLYLGMKIEHYTGRLSVILIYFFSRVGGLLVSVCVCTQWFVSVDVSGPSTRFMGTNRSHTV